MNITAPKWSVLIGWLLVNLIGFGFAGALFHNFPLNFSPSPNTFRTPFDLTPAVAGFFFGVLIVDALGLPDDGRGNALQHGLLGGAAGLMVGLSTVFIMLRFPGRPAEPA